MPHVHHRYASVGGHQLFYREAGPADAPTVVLLHGFPASSFMFRNLVPALADRYHVIAPDYLSFGLSDAPAAGEFDYTFETLTDLIAGLLDQLGVTRYAVYVQDYGAPVGFWLALRDPGAITAIITQNGNGYDAGFWQTVRNYQKEQNAQTESAAGGLGPRRSDLRPGRRPGVHHRRRGRGNPSDRRRSLPARECRRRRGVDHPRLPRPTPAVPGGHGPRRRPVRGGPLTGGG
jgi:pimeloyl-ACP methyl ester carboxylesterase